VRARRMQVERYALLLLTASVFSPRNCGRAQAQSAKLIGEAVKQNPAFLTLRKIEVRGSEAGHRVWHSCRQP
jgi:hypothetical protein